ARNAAKALSSDIHAGKQANEPSGWSTTTNGTPPRSRRRLTITVSPKRGWNRYVMGTSAGCSRAVCRASEQHLDRAHVDGALQQMRGEGVAQGVRRDPGAEPCRLRRHMADAIELSGRYRQQRITAGEQPALRAALQPPRPEQIEQLRREHRV